jgi:FAD/FMN-containing dehydrogenase
VGGKRYMSGFMEGWTAHEWSQHYGGTWPQFSGQKKRFDPRGLLNNAHIRWR